MSRTRRIAVLSGFAILTIVSLSACGYNMGSSLDPRYQTIHVLPFKNDTGEYDLQAPLTNAITRKFINDGRLRVVDRAAADLLIEGSILDYQLRGLTFDREDEVIQFEMVITAQTRVFDPDTGDILWTSRHVIGENTYSTPRIGSSSDRLRGNTQTFTPTVRSFQTDEENRAASEAIEGVASEIFIRTIEPW